MEGGNTSKSEYHRDRSGGSTQFHEPADHDMPPNLPYFSASSTVWSSTSISSIPVRGTFTPVYAGSSRGGSVSPGGMMIPIGAKSHMRVREVAFLVLLMNRRREEGDGLVEEKNLDVVNRKTQEPEMIRVIGEEDTKRD